MDPGFEIGDGNRPPSTESAVARLVAWLLSRVGLNPGGGRVFADRLSAAFRSGLSVNHPADGPWFAALDAIDPDDNQAAALVRLSHRLPETPREIQRGMVDVEERNRELFAESASTIAPEDADLLLTYSFSPLLSLDQNLELFREFAANELGRLRAREANKH